MPQLTMLGARWGLKPARIGSGIMEKTMKTKILLTAGAMALVGVNLSGCALLGAKPAELAPVIEALADAGCQGDLQFNAGAGSAAGLSPGAFHLDNTFHGSCDPARGRPQQVVPLSDIQKILGNGGQFGSGGATGQVAVKPAGGEAPK